MDTVIIITKDKNDNITIHFDGKVTFIEGFELANEILAKGIDIVAHSRVFMKHSKN